MRQGRKPSHSSPVRFPEIFLPLQLFIDVWTQWSWRSFPDFINLWLPCCWWQPHPLFALKDQGSGALTIAPSLEGSAWIMPRPHWRPEDLIYDQYISVSRGTEADPQVLKPCCTYQGFMKSPACHKSHNSVGLKLHLGNSSTEIRACLKDHRANVVLWELLAWQWNFELKISL